MRSRDRDGGASQCTGAGLIDVEGGTAWQGGNSIRPVANPAFAIISRKR